MTRLKNELLGIDPTLLAWIETLPEATRRALSVALVERISDLLRISVTAAPANACTTAPGGSVEVRFLAVGYLAKVRLQDAVPPLLLIDLRPR